MLNVESIRNNAMAIKNQAGGLKSNKIHGMDLGEYIFKRVITRVDPIEYCQRVLRGHLPESRKYLHENQIELIRAATNPSIRQVAGLMARQAGKTESIASISGYLLDNYPEMRIGIFTPRLQQAEINVGRTSVFFQMNEDKLNNKLVKCTKQKIELSNGSYVLAVSGSDQSNIEGFTFDVIILDEAQRITDYTWSERIAPMGGATNAKMIKIGTPKTRNHFYKAMEGEESSMWYRIKRDWTQCPQLWALGATHLPDYTDPKSGILRPYSTYVLNLMPKSLKQEYFPYNPEIWNEGSMSVEDFKTQYMLEFVDGAGQFLTTKEWEQMTSGDFKWGEYSNFGEKLYAGIDFAGSSSDGADFTHISVIRLNQNLEKQKIFAMDMHGSEYSYPEQMREIFKLFGGPSPRFNVQSIFADYTGCGRPVVQTLQEEYGIAQLTGITFNGRDAFTNSGMNMKNIMFSTIKNEIAHGRFKYPKRDMYASEVKSDEIGFYHKMIGEWRDLEFENRSINVNKRIEAPSGGHDDVPCADALANFAAMHSEQKSMPRATTARIFRG